MKILESKLRKIIKEELQLEGDGARRQESLVKDLNKVKRWFTATRDMVKKSGENFEVESQLTGALAELESFQKQLEEYFYNVGDHTMEEGKKIK